MFRFSNPCTWCILVLILFTLQVSFGELLVHWTFAVSFVNCYFIWRYPYLLVIHLNQEPSNRFCNSGPWYHAVNYYFYPKQTRGAIVNTIFKFRLQIFNLNNKLGNNPKQINVKGTMRTQFVFAYLWGGVKIFTVHKPLSTLSHFFLQMNRPRTTAMDTSELGSEWLQFINCSVTWWKSCPIMRQRLWHLSISIHSNSIHRKSQLNLTTNLYDYPLTDSYELMTETQKEYL